jgi:nucleoid-associated protein EbfC
MNFRGGMGELMRQAGRVQRKVEKRREELKGETFEATAVANGVPELAEIRIDKALLEEEGLEMVQDLVVAATNAALTKAREHIDAEIEKITGGLSIPGLG